MGRKESNQTNKSPASLCVVSFSKTRLSLLSTGSPQEDRSQHNWKTVHWEVKNQIKQTNPIFHKVSVPLILNTVSLVSKK